MIGRVTRGWRVGGLIRYLMGPGRFNEHRDPRIIATWDGRPAAWAPRERPDGSHDVSDVAAAVADAQLAAGIPQNEPPPRPDRNGRMRVPRGPVWHCSLRNHPDDPVLSDAQWAEIAREVLDRTGIAPRGDLFGCRWVLIRHADDHVHLAAVLVRLDTGTRVHPKFDYPKLRQVCREAEGRLGLFPTGDADRTASCAPTRAEQEKAARRAQRRGDPEQARPSRLVLCQAARTASVQARTPEEFLELVASPAVKVRVHRSRAGEIDGYALALVTDRDRDRNLVWFSGSRLARDLSMPRLKAMWAGADEPGPQAPPEPHERHTPGRAERLGALDEATDAVEEATEALRQARLDAGDEPDGLGADQDSVRDGVHEGPVHDDRHHDPAHESGGDDAVHDEAVHDRAHGGAVHDPVTGPTVPGPQAEEPAVTHEHDEVLAAGVAHSLRDLLVALDLTAHDAYPELGDAARLFDRAARTPRTVLPDRWSEEARHLRTAAWRLSAVRALPARGPARAPLAALVAAIATLVAELAAYQATKQRLAQARAAHRCADALAVAGERRTAGTQPAGRTPRAPQRSSSPSPAARRPAPTPRRTPSSPPAPTAPRRPGPSR